MLYLGSYSVYVTYPVSKHLETENRLWLSRGWGGEDRHGMSLWVVRVSSDGFEVELVVVVHL